MSGDTTYQALIRLTYLREREANENGNVIAGQPFDDIYFFGGEIHNVDLINCTADGQPITGGSGGYEFEQILSVGTSATITQPGTMLLCNSATDGDKTVIIPQAAGTKKIITIADVLGNAELFNIRAVPSLGSISGNDTVYTNKGSIDLYDSSTLGLISI